tara:strand:- start:977 stop:1141 length:165 start_codon:yes stop_codon:yes gene_type:complete
MTESLLLSNDETWVHEETSSLFRCKVGKCNEPWFEVSVKGNGTSAIDADKLLIE